MDQTFALLTSLESYRPVDTEYSRKVAATIEKLHNAAIAHEGRMATLQRRSETLESMYAKALIKLDSAHRMFLEQLALFQMGVQKKGKTVALSADWTPKEKIQEHSRKVNDTHRTYSRDSSQLLREMALESTRYTETVAVLLRELQTHTNGLIQMHGTFMESMQTMHSNVVRMVTRTEVKVPLVDVGHPLPVEVTNPTMSTASELRKMRKVHAVGLFADTSSTGLGTSIKTEPMQQTEEPTDGIQIEDDEDDEEDKSGEGDEEDSEESVGQPMDLKDMYKALFG